MDWFRWPLNRRAPPYDCSCQTHTYGSAALIAAFATLQSETCSVSPRHHQPQYLQEMMLTSTKKRTIDQCWEMQFPVLGLVEQLSRLTADPAVFVRHINIGSTHALLLAACRSTSALRTLPERERQIEKKGKNKKIFTYKKKRTAALLLLIHISSGTIYHHPLGFIWQRRPKRSMRIFTDRGFPTLPSFCHEYGVGVWLLFLFHASFALFWKQK